MDKNRNANANFAGRIISYFNRTYKVSVPEYKIDEKTLPMGFRPVYDTYVDVVIEHLGGKSFRETAVERTARTPEQSCQTGILEQSQDGVEEGQDNLSRNHPFRRFSMQYNQRNRISYNYGGELETLCAGIAYGADDILNGNSKMIIRFDDNDISVTDWYDLTTTNAEQIRFYKNGRIDVRFKDSAAAESCFKRLHLDEITLREN